MSEYPEHDKLTAIQAQSQKIGEFLEWLQCDKHVRLLGEYGSKTTEEGEPVYVPIRQSKQQLLAEFFEIDLAKLEEEKRQMLAKCRAMHSDGD